MATPLPPVKLVNEPVSDLRDRRKQPSVPGAEHVAFAENAPAVNAGAAGNVAAGEEPFAESFAPAFRAGDWTHGDHVTSVNLVAQPTIAQVVPSWQPPTGDTT